MSEHEYDPTDELSLDELDEAAGGVGEGTAGAAGPNTNCVAPCGNTNCTAGCGIAT